MPKLIIHLKKDNDFIEKCFDEIAKEKYMTNIKLKVFKAIYKSKLNSLFFIYKNTFKKFISDKEDRKEFMKYDDCPIYLEGDEEYITQQKNKLQNILLADEATISNEKEYQNFKGDRTVKRITHSFKKVIGKSKDIALKKALRGCRVLDFLMRIGIIITWKIEEQNGVV